VAPTISRRLRLRCRAAWRVSCMFIRSEERVSVAPLSGRGWRKGCRRSFGGVGSWEMSSRTAVLGTVSVTPLLGWERVYRNWPDLEELVTAALLRYSGSVELEDTGDLRHDLVNYLVALAGLLSTTTGRAMQRVIQSARENPEVALPVNRIFERRLANLQQVVDRAVARGELPPVDGYFLAEMLTSWVHLYVSRGLHPFTRAEAERTTDVVLTGLRHTAGQLPPPTTLGLLVFTRDMELLPPITVFLPSSKPRNGVAGLRSWHDNLPFSSAWPVG